MMETSEITQRVMEIVQALASSLQVASSEIWQILLLQAKVSAGISLVNLITTLFCYIAFLWFYNKKLKPVNLDWDSRNELFSVLKVLSTVFLILFTFFVFFRTQFLTKNILTGLINPRFWAIQEVAEQYNGVKK